MSASPSDENVLVWLGTTYQTVLSSADSGGAMCIIDSTAPPNSGPPRHIHKTEDETFVILSGRCRVWIEGREHMAKAGDSVFIARGKEHTFKVTDDAPCRHLVILTPGGFEGFFADMATGQFAIPDDMPAIAESAERHNLALTGPPLD